MRVRRFNDLGVEEFARTLEEIRINPEHKLATELLDSAEYTVAVTGAREVEGIAFRNRREAAEYLLAVLDNVSGINVETDCGLWSWLALFFFDQLCPPNASGARLVRDRARYIPEVSDFRKYYRHLLAGPYRVAKAYRQRLDSAMVLLCGPLDKPGDIVEQMVSRQEIVTNPGIVEAATQIYFDKSVGGFKRGSAGAGAGSARRFVEVLNQFDVTWDLYAMNSAAIVNRLPQEFDKFRR